MAYPDYGKAPPEYIASIISVIASYDERTQAAMADLKTGVVSKCKFLPTIADVVEFADAFREKHKPPKGPWKPFVVDAKQYPEERKRVGEKMAAFLAELKNNNNMSNPK